MKIRNPKTDNEFYSGFGFRASDFFRISVFGFRIFLLLLAYCWPAPHSSACSVPVFRYALERWPTSPYELILFHQGPLSETEQALAKRLADQEYGTNPPVNVTLRTVDVAAGEVPADLAPLWRRYQNKSVPLLVLLYPRGAAAEGVVWSGPAGDQSARRILDSPVRRRIARRLLQGESSVWVFLESGDKARDDAAAAQLEKELEQQQTKLKLPQVAEEDLSTHRISATQGDLKLVFSLVRLSRTDPEEEVFVRMLLGSEEDLRDTKEPMAFPIFGRGRALFGLVGKGINSETIEEACSFLIGPCSCVVKEMNPGLDLLMTADWDGAVAAQSTPHELPELTGLDDLQAPPETAAPAQNVQSQNSPSNQPLAQVSIIASASPPAPVPITHSPFGIGLLAAGGLGALLFLGGLFILLRRRE